MGRFRTGGQWREVRASSEPGRWTPRPFGEPRCCRETARPRHLRRPGRGRPARTVQGRPDCKFHVADERRCRRPASVLTKGQAADSPRLIPVIRKGRSVGLWTTPRSRPNTPPGSGLHEQVKSSSRAPAGCRRRRLIPCMTWWLSLSMGLWPASWGPCRGCRDRVLRGRCAGVAPTRVHVEVTCGARPVPDRQRTASLPKPATSRPPGRSAADRRSTTALSGPGASNGKILPAATTRSKSPAMPSGSGSNSARSIRNQGSPGACLRATASIDASRSTPTQSYPSSASRIMTRPVPHPASSTRAPTGTRAAQNRA